MIEDLEAMEKAADDLMALTAKCPKHESRIACLNAAAILYRRVYEAEKALREAKEKSE